jgi:S-adenosylmethionine synthetase
MGRKPETVTKTFTRPGENGLITKEMTVNLFAWEKLDMVDAIKSAMNLS